MSETGPAVLCWTRQARPVWDELRARGSFVVREEHVRAKNGPIADYYLEVYRWYTERCRRLLPIPEHAICPIWLALSEDTRLPAARGTVTLEMEVPANRLFAIDSEKWDYRLNYWYLPEGPEDEARHAAELARYAIASEASLIQTDRGNYHPALRQKIVGSWERLFSEPPRDPSRALGTVWELRREWVRKVVSHDAG